MFKNKADNGFLTVLYAIGAKPLLVWDTYVKNGHIKRVTDPDIQSASIEIVGANVNTTFITCPIDQTVTLGIKLPYFVLLVKNVIILIKYS